MALVKTYPFDNPLNYTVPSGAEIIGGTVKLKLVDNITQTFTQDFSNDTGFIYDTSKTEFVGGVVKQLDQRPANSILGATYTDNVNANWAIDGFTDLTGNLRGSPTLAGGKLVCGLGDNGVYYEDSSIGSLSGDMVIKFEFTPAYSGSPVSNTNIVSVERPILNTDRIVIFHSSIGSLRITANGLSAIVFDNWVPVAGTSYIFEVHVVSNSVTLFIDNIQIGGAKAITPGQGTSTTRLYIGASKSLYSNANGSYDNVILYSSTSQTPTYTIPETSYFNDTITLPNFIYSGLGSIQAFTDFTTVETNIPHYNINGLYWNGASWVSSDDSYAQSNTEFIIVSNIVSLPLSDTITVKVITDSSNSSMSADTLTITYTGQIYTTNIQEIEFNDVTRLEELCDFTLDSTIVGGDNITFRLSKDNVKYWFDGVEWSVSTNTSEANTADVIEVNKLTFTIVPVDMQIFMLLKSSDGSTSPIAYDVTICYDFAGDEDVLSKTIVYGFSVNPDCTPNTGKITAVLNISANEYKQTTQVSNKEISVIPDSTEGRWEMEMLDNDSMETGSYYTFIWGTGRREDKVVPLTNTVSYNALVDVT